MATIHELIEELHREATTTRRVIERVPQDRLAWRPHPRSLTLGQLAMHVATIPGALAEIAVRSDFDVTAPIPRPGAESTDEVVAVLEASVARAHAVLSGMTDDALDAPWPMLRDGQQIGAMPRGVFLRSVMLNHWYHHRGQLSVYLRENDVPIPAIYGDSADERMIPA